MAIPLVYKSCLSIDSFDQAVADYTRYKQALLQQETDKLIWEQ